MLIDKLKKYKILLATRSERRQQLLKSVGIGFIPVNDRETDENIPGNLGKFEIPVYLAEKKSGYYYDLLSDDYTILITADTIVWHQGNLIGKPSDREEAINILKYLSGKNHEVITGVTLRSRNKIKSFYAHTKVHFSVLQEEEILHYVEMYKPFDKAGAYGIQEWIGYIGIDHIEGSFYNVMGLPVHMLYRELDNFLA